LTAGILKEIKERHEIHFAVDANRISCRSVAPGRQAEEDTPASASAFASASESYF